MLVFWSELPLALQTFGTLLTEYNFKVIIEIIGKGELDNSCITIDSQKDGYIGRLISVFE